MTKARITALFCILTLAAFAADSFAAETAVKLGDITSYTGDVLVRTKGDWEKLSKVPHPVYSSDKVVTKRGRAEIRLSDGGVVRMDLDTNLSIVKRSETEGFIFKKQVSTRVVNVMVGKMWFDVRLQKDERMKFNTPTMTAAIRGTSGKFDVAPDGGTKFGLKTGSAEVEGKFEKLDSPDPINESDTKVSTESLPQSNPAVQESKPMQDANKAFEADQKAESAKQQAQQQQGQQQPAAGQPATQAQINAAEAALLDAEAELINASLDLAEAQTVGDPIMIEVAEQNVLEAVEAVNDAQQTYTETTGEPAPAPAQELPYTPPAEEPAPVTEIVPVTPPPDELLTSSPAQ